MENKKNPYVEDKFNYSSKDTTLDNLPENVMISLTSKCNLSCWHCYKSFNERKGYDTPRWIIDYVNQKIIPYSKYLRIGGNDLGEPLLSKNFYYFFSTLKREKLKEVSLVTNLTLLNDKNAELIAKKVDKIEISIEGTAEKYSQIRNFNWEMIVEKIKLLEQYRKKNKNSNLKITLLVCTMLNNLENLINIFDLKSIGVDQIIFREFKPCEKEKSIECLWQDPKKTFKYIKKFEEKSKEINMPIEITFKEKYNLTKQHENKKPKRILKVNKCFLPWTTISIDSSGNVSCCCESLRLAKLKNFDENILNVWNNEKFSALRRTVNSKKPWIHCLDCEIKNIYLTGTKSINRSVCKILNFVRLSAIKLNKWIKNKPTNH